MQLYVCNNTQENLSYILSQQPVSKKLKICNGITATEHELYETDIIYNLHLFIKKQLDASKDINSLPTKLLLKNPYVTIICDDIKNEYSPLEKGQIIYKEKIAYICDELTKRSQRVEHIHNDRRSILKNKPNTLLCCFIRHGKTLGNLNRRYIGITDENLCNEGIDELTLFKSQGIYPTSHRLYASPLTRCIETARILYPNQPLLSCNLLKECNFGEFENKNYKELQDHPYYQKWVDSNGCLPFPNGETPALFTKRCVKGFLACINHIPHKSSFTYDTSSWITFIVHGGTIMSILSELTIPKGDYFSFQIENGKGYFCEFDLNKQVLTILDCIK